LAFGNLHSFHKGSKSLNGLAIGYGANGMLTGNGKITGCFWRKNGEIETLLFEFDVDLTKIDTKSCFEDNFSVLLWKSQRQRLNTHIVRDLGVTYSTLVKFNRLVFSFVNFVVSLQAEIS
jgi:hypothetical protein